MEAPTTQTVEPKLADPTNPILLSAVRHGLTTFAGILVADGYVTRSSGQILVSVLLMALVAGWSIFEKTKAAQKFNALILSALPDIEAALQAIPDASGQARQLSQNSSPTSTSTPPPGAGNGPAPGSGGAALLIAVLSGLSIAFILGALTGCAAGDNSGNPSVPSSKVQIDLTAVGNYLSSPTTQAALDAVANTVVDAASGQDVTAVINGVDAATLLVRSLQSTPRAASSSAVSDAVKSGGAPPAVATKAAAAVTALVAAGATADQANEAVAVQLDSAVQQLTTAAP
jgi:hypothetical protein